MFYLQYLKAELIKRLGKTITISLGLGITSAIIVAIVSVSQGLSNTQKQVLNPLENVGTDLVLTRSIGQEEMRTLDEATRTEYAQENRVTTDLSKLGKAGDNFKLDTFLAGNMLSFSTDELKKMDASLVKDYAAGLILNVMHQEGKIPEIVAEFKTQEQEMQIAPLTAEEEKAINDARTKAMEELKAKGIDPRSDEGRQYIRDAVNAVTPERMKKFRIPAQTFRQQLNTPQTDIKTENFTVAGVDLTKSALGLILKDQIVQGNYFTGEDQAVVNISYAQKKGLKIGDKINLANKDFNIVGFVEPKLYAYPADIYLPLATLQKLAGKENRVNIVLIKSSNASSVEETSKKLADIFVGAKVSDSADLAKQVTGSLINAANLTNKFVGLVTLIVILAGFIIVSLLSLLSLNKRVNELGTLKAIGWSDALVVRQVFLENLVLGILGGLVGIGIGMLFIYIINRFDISLTANFLGGGSMQEMARRFLGQSGTKVATVKLKIDYSYLVMLIGGGVALLGSILAGGVSAFRTIKLKPSEAIRKVE